MDYKDMLLHFSGMVLYSLVFRYFLFFSGYFSLRKKNLVAWVLSDEICVCPVQLGLGVLLSLLSLISHD